ncbi:PHB depolymerase family esterase [Ancylobacter sonchi]|uniref:extracellular catalytic domain type 1 short-chain-length polyhydroxyalkanoate depolymerase n=1 Tax=Ancylobacter sonchi TaxID=1937790 RepID=UPI001BD6D8EF|nr:PHB depolymerase family esterase [Ancylobacter sonchi]MBS7532276.1 PHB depolymerase family esterase [Ancylobacter sonchi]
MKTMSDMIARLAAFRGPQGAHLPGAGVPDRLTTFSDFGSNPGRLKSRFYLPSNLTKGAPLVVVLHGCTQSAAGYDHHAGWSQLADRAGFALLFPEQHHGNNPNLCFNWFRPGDTRRDAGEALSIRQMIEAMIVANGLDRDRIFVTGLSAGGAMASVMLATYPEVFAGGAIIAGLAYGRASTVPEAFDCMRGQGAASKEELWALLREASTHAGPWPRIAIWQGTADHTVAPSNAEDIAAQWCRVHQLDNAPTRSEVLGVRAKHSWCNAAGEAVIELNTISAMGHGTPLGDGLGVPGPYMLEVGISSTREIAQFWGIAQAREEAVACSATAVIQGKLVTLPSPAERTPGIKKVGPAIHATASRRTPPASDESGVKKIIEDALRAAGLMR